MHYQTRSDANLEKEVRCLHDLLLESRKECRDLKLKIKAADDQLKKLHDTIMKYAKR